MNVAKLIARELAKHGGPVGVRRCTLVRVTLGARDPGAVTAGQARTEARYAATGLVESYSSYTIAASAGQILATDRKVTILGGSLPAGITPQALDRIEIGSEVLTIVQGSAVTADPARATYTCQCRG